MNQAVEQAAVSPQEYEAKCQWALGPWFRQADMLPNYPASTEDVAELMNANEYDCPKDLVIRFMEDGVIRKPEMRNGRLIWTAADILSLTIALEFRRCWKRFSKLHGHKLTQFEKLQELAELDGGKCCFEDLAKWDIAGLIALLHEPGCDLGARTAIAVALRHKLREKGIDL